MVAIFNFMSKLKILLAISFPLLILSFFLYPMESVHAQDQSIISYQSDSDSGEQIYSFTLEIGLYPDSFANPGLRRRWYEVTVKGQDVDFYTVSSRTSSDGAFQLWNYFEALSFDPFTMSYVEYEMDLDGKVTSRFVDCGCGYKTDLAHDYYLSGFMCYAYYSNSTEFSSFNLSGFVNTYICGGFDRDYFSELVGLVNDLHRERAIEFVENGGIDWEEKLPVYDASLPYITNLQYDSLTGSACHNESTLNGCFRLAWDVPFGVTEDDALDIRVAADYNYATDISSDRQFSSCFLNLTDIYGYIPISDSPFKFCVKDFIQYVDTSDSHFGFNSSEVYGFTFVPKRIYIRIVRNSSDGSFFGDWVIYDVNRDVLNRPQVGLGQIVPGDTEIDDSGDFVYPSSDTVTLNDFFLSNVKLVKEFVVSNVGYYKITWNGTTRSSDLVFIPDSDTAVIAVIILTDSFGNISNKTVATTTIGKGFFRFNIDELLDYEDESSLYWDGFIYVMPTFKRNGDLYMGQYSVVNALNGDIYQDTIDESDGSLHRELVSSENTAAVSGSFSSSSLIDYVNEGFNFLNSLVVMMKDFPALVAAVFQFIPSVYINAIGVMLIIMLIARILGR